jgi:probable HAF family extracellular repeat protein
MTIRTSNFRRSALLLGILSITLSALEPNGVSKFRDVKAPGATETDTYAVNNFGVIAGDYVDGNNIQHGMILNGKQLTTVNRRGCLTTPGPGAIALFGLTSKQVAVGWCFDTIQQTNVAFEYNHGRITTIALSGAVSTQAQGINDLGRIVGAYLDSAGQQHGFLLSGAKLTTLDVPNHTFASAYAINNQGLITIYAANSSGSYDSFITLNGRSYKLVNVPNAAQSIVHGINRFGDRVYTYVDSAGAEHGSFFIKGKYYSFDDPKGRGTTRADGLNDKLEIVGRYSPKGSRPASAANVGFAAYGCCRTELGR